MRAPSTGFPDCKGPKVKFLQSIQEIEFKSMNNGSYKAVRYLLFLTLQIISLFFSLESSFYSKVNVTAGKAIGENAKLYMLELV